jgi:hypothetical protein
VIEVNLPISELRNNFRLFVATPMYGGMCNGLFMKSCLDLHTLFAHLGVEIRFSFLFNESLIPRARNYLVDEFLRAESVKPVMNEKGERVGEQRNPYTHFLFLDGDIEFDANDVLTLMVLQKDLICGPYPKKSINWGNIKEAIKKNPEVDAGALSAVMGEYVFNPVPGTTQFSVNDPLEVLESGTGYMMIKRDVFGKFAEAYPHLRYKPDHMGQQNFDGSRYIHAFFDTEIKNERYLSEDYMFCQKWREIGGQVFLCPWMKTKHLGTFAFEGNLPAIAALTGKL